MCAAPPSAPACRLPDRQTPKLSAERSPAHPNLASTVQSPIVLLTAPTQNIHNPAPAKYKLYTSANVSSHLSCAAVRIICESKEQRRYRTPFVQMERSLSDSQACPL